jgi:hypothetical protein
MSVHGHNGSVVVGLAREDYPAPMMINSEQAMDLILEAAEGCAGSHCGYGP